MIRNNDYFEIIKEQNKELAKFRPFKSAYEMKEEIERLNTKEEQLIRRLEDLIIVGEQVENEWAIDICKMVIKELKGSDKKWIF